MPLLSKDCLQRLRDKIDLTEVVGAHIPLKNHGGKIKALCPFHKEKTPSFHVNRGDSHYHCFGCGAHGDSIAFLMNYLGVTFREAVEYLADKYHLTLEYSGKEQKDNSYKRDLLNVNKLCCEFFHFHLMHSEEGKKALEYLFKRGITSEFIKKFQIGYSPANEHFQKSFFQKEGFNEKTLSMAGILSESTKRPFFNQRIMFPIHDGVGNVIAFSGRKIDEKVFGGKYVNTKETPVFKKSRILYGLNYCRRNIAKNRRVLVVEGQIDALRCIYEGFDYVVASQGTAFGEEHVNELVKLGVDEVTICFDSDEAGNKSAIKVGQLFQIEGLEVFICKFPEGVDPDTCIVETGKEGFANLLLKKMPFLHFLVEMKSRDGGDQTPAKKNGIVTSIKKMMSEWKHPIMVHEGEKVLSRLLHLPGKYVIDSYARVVPKKVSIEKVEQGYVEQNSPLEEDLVRWLLLIEEKSYLDIIFSNINKHHICSKSIGHIFSLAESLYKEEQKIDLLHLGVDLEADEISYIEHLQKKKLDWAKAETGVTLLCQKILDKKWMKQRESIREKMRSKELSESELFALAKEFDQLQQPSVKLKEKT